MLCLFLPLAGCLAGTSSGRSTTAYVHDDGMHPVQRTTVTQTYSGRTFGASVPFVMAGGGYGYGGYGPMAVNSGSCVLHPDNCAVIQTVPAVGMPMTVVSTGGGVSSTVGPGGAGTYGPADTSDLEERIERLETAVPKLAGAGILSLRQSCLVIMKDPSVIKDAAERDSIVAGCEKVLKSNPNADATSEEK